MQESLAREIGLLRTLAANLEHQPLPFEQVTREYMRQHGLGEVHEKAGGIISVRIPGRHAFTELTDCLLDRNPAMERGAIYADVQTELFTFIERLVGVEPSRIDRSDAEALIAYFERWFADRISPRRVFVPCVISRTPAPRFEIGPITFEFTDQVETSDYYPRGDGEEALDRRGFDDLLKWMREYDANWLARVAIDGCEHKRAEELAELAVDLAIVAFQLSAPKFDTRSMARLDARRGTSQKRTLSESDGYHGAGWTRKEPGLSIGQGTLPDILQKVAPVFTAVGNMVRSFCSGSYRLPNLERAWCDAAYWLHQALAESLDTIAVAQLETALEVLSCAESSRGSERRMLDILSAFFNLGPDDPVTENSLLSAKQFARKIVGDRSRVLHGTWSTLNARGMDRVGMEGFVVTVVRAYALELEVYASSAAPIDNTSEFLASVRQRRAFV